MKIALCFIISYKHILNKEEIWREWIEYNKDIINVYFYYKDLTKITSEWILKHVIPSQKIYDTSYYHVIPAYISLMQFAIDDDLANQWICFLTDSCCPIVSPKKFRYLFYTRWNKSIMSWKPAWWNIHLHRRANLSLLPKDCRLANDPWFVLKRETSKKVLHFIKKNAELTNLICIGGLANESLFAIILYFTKQLNTPHVLNCVTHLTDWSRMGSSTSPHTFIDGNTRDIHFIEENLKKNECAMFIRKVSPDFSDEVIKKYIYEYNREKDEKLVIKKSFVFVFKEIYLGLFKFLYFVFYTACNFFSRCALL